MPKTNRESDYFILQPERVMEQRRLGGEGLVVSALGLGCMGMSWAYGPRDEAESIATIHEAIAGERASASWVDHGLRAG